MPAHATESPAKKQSKWTPDEDAVIIELRGSGMKWEDISKRLPGRSAISCRLHYQNYLERRSEWDEERKNKLARLYERFKPEMWAKVAEEMQIPWRAAEAMHWHLGEQDMARRAGVTPFSLSASTVIDTPQSSGPRGSPRHQVHSITQGILPRDVVAAHGRGSYSRVAPALPPGRPLASRRESIPPPPPSSHHHHHHYAAHLPPHSEHLDAYGYHQQPPPPLNQHPHHPGGPLPPLQIHGPPQLPGMLPGITELTTSASPYSTPAYSIGAPSASPAHSATASPGPFMTSVTMASMGYVPLDPVGSNTSKRRRSPDTLPSGVETSRRRHLDSLADGLYRS